MTDKLLFRRPLETNNINGSLVWISPNLVTPKRVSNNVYLLLHRLTHKENFNEVLLLQ